MRKDAFQRRKAAHETYRDTAPEAIIPPILELSTRGDIFTAYVPIRTEINVLPAMNALHALGKHIAVPVIIENGAPLEFHRWTPEMAMKIGAFGANIPENADELLPDIVLAPLVAFDETGTRLGYGGGFYDRTLETLRKVKPVLFVGIAYSGQEMAELPRDATDIALDAIITERGCHWFS